MRINGREYEFDTKELERDFDETKRTMHSMGFLRHVPLTTEVALKEFCETYKGKPTGVKMSLKETSQNWEHETDVIKVGPDIKELTINNSFVHKLDLSEAKSLESLTLKHNKGLREVVGLESLTGLRDVELVENPFRYDPIAVLGNNPDLGDEAFGIDIETFAEHKGLLKELYKDSELDPRITILHAVNDIEDLPVDPAELTHIDEIVDRVLSVYGTDNMTQQEKTLGILNYVISQKTSLEDYGGSVYDNDPRIRQHTMMGAIDGTGAVCSGKSHLAKYMLEKAGIEADIVSASLLSDSGKHGKYLGAGEQSDHELVRVKNENGTWSYTDVTNETSYDQYDDMYMANTMLSLDDLCAEKGFFSISTKLPPTEKEFEGKTVSIPVEEKVSAWVSAREKAEQNLYDIMMNQKQKKQEQAMAGMDANKKRHASLGKNEKEMEKTGQKKDGKDDFDGPK